MEEANTKELPCLLQSIPNGQNRIPVLDIVKEWFYRFSKIILTGNKKMSLSTGSLRESNEFLNVLLDNIRSAVLVVDQEFRIRQFNNALGKIFGKEHGNVEGEVCGEALGCSFTLLEKKPCGQTSRCHKCQLRHSILRTFELRHSGKRKKLSRQFFSGDTPVLKHLEYFTRFIRFAEQEFTLVIMDDITERELRKQELVHKQKQLDLDLQAAAGIQQSLLPARASVIEHLEAAWQFLPCSRIGGDIFNLFALGGNRTGCYMMDASGHGVHSALVAVSVSQLLQPSSSRLPLGSPAAVCRELDNQYPMERFNTFFSMIYMVIDSEAGVLSWCNAGHPPAVLVRSTGKMEILEAGSPIIGLGGLLPFREGRKEIGAGDRIFLYTDGLIERRNREGELYGLKRLLARIESTPNIPLGEALAGLLESAIEFGDGAAPADDISLLGLELN
jgi:phosphoserine phosphatase RsbU/P